MCDPKQELQKAQLNSQAPEIREAASIEGVRAICTGGYKGPKTPANG
jgi:hypothetical protein